MIRFGMSGLPPDDGDDAAFLDGVAAAGHRAYELAFVDGFPWKIERCRRFGDLAASRDIALSIHAPYFAVLTVEDPQRRTTTIAALEHTLKLAGALGARMVVAHTGYTKGREATELLDLAREGLDRLSSKIGGNVTPLGLETSGTERSFGSLGDIALLAGEFPFVRPVVDWAHVHALSGGRLVDRAAFEAVFAFLREEFAGWRIDPLHTQFTDNLFGPKGEIKHVPYGLGSLRIAPLVEAALDAGVRLTVISEAHDRASHDRIFAELQATLMSRRPVPSAGGRALVSGLAHFPEPLRVEPAGDGFRPVGLHRPLRLSNPDKVFFPAAGYTKGDLIQHYASVAPLLLPHLADRAIVLARFPDGAEGDWFYEKECPSHRPQWLPTAPLWSEHREAPINFCTAPDREALMWIANLGCIELHPWLSRIARPDRPDFAIFDLDPAAGATWEQVVMVGRLVKVALDRLGLYSYPKTSGATGLHIYVPLEPVHPYRRVRRFVEAVGRLLAAADPDNVTMEWEIPRRAGRVFIDHNQNVGGKTIASVYSVRPTQAATVSTPLDWSELDSVTPGDFTIATVWDRLARHGDLFAPVLRGGQRLDAAEEALGLEPAATVRDVDTSRERT